VTALCHAGVPVNTCQNGSNSTSSLSCNIAAVGAHHAIVVLSRSTSSTLPIVSYSDTQGNTGSLDFNATCNPPGTPCTAPGYWSTNYAAAGAGHGGLFAFSTGIFTGSDTFTLSWSVAQSDSLLWVGEYSEDFLGLDTFNAGVTAPTTYFTTAANDVVVTVRLAAFGCSAGTPAAGFTMEVNIASVTPGSCTALADEINVAPSTFDATITTFANPQPTISFGVATFIVKKKSGAQVY
jgi:hypothetical protein